METKKILLVCHAPSPNLERLRDAAAQGLRHPFLECTEFRAVPPLQATAEDVLAADAVVLGTPENFGYMSGALKDFFDRIYEPCLEHTRALPLGYFVRAGKDGTGASRAIESIAKGLGWRLAVPALICKGDDLGLFEEQVEEMTSTLAAGLESGLY